MSSDTSAVGPHLRSLPDHPHVFSSVLDLIGNTPLIQIPLDWANARGQAALAERNPGATLWGKLESANPAGSVKDRIALAMVESAEREGKLAKGGTVIEPTSGNTGIGLALVCARKGYRCVLTMPSDMSLERRALLKALGAEVVLTDAKAQMEGAIARAQELANDCPGSFLPQQFDNHENPDVHYHSTAQEIILAMSERPLAAFVAGIGTGGTISGVGKALREKLPDCKIIGVEAEACATITRGERGFTRIQGWAAGFVPKNYAAHIPHEVQTVSDQDAYRCKQLLARRTGMLLGISSGGAVHVATKIARKLPHNSHVVVILPDTGERYFSLDEYFE